jgi:type I restriction enzyme R subunit
VIKVVGEIVMELAPDGHTLRTLSYRNYTRAALRGLTTTPQSLIARWLQRDQREEVRARLEDEGIDLDALAAALGQPDLDPLDLLLQIAFGQRSPTRRERADRLRREQAAFFARYGPAAREILEIVLDKYVAGEAPDISDPQLLRVPLARLGRRRRSDRPAQGRGADRFRQRPADAISRKALRGGRQRYPQ